MVAEAVAEAGVDDFAADDGFWDRVAAYAGAIDGDDGLTQLIRGTLRQRMVRLLRNRLSLTELIKRHPEIESIPIEKPFIVVGMPRSGTTHLVEPAGRRSSAPRAALLGKSRAAAYSGPGS